MRLSIREIELCTKQTAVSGARAKIENDIIKRSVRLKDTCYILRFIFCALSYQYRAVLVIHSSQDFLIDFHSKIYFISVLVSSEIII